MAPQNPADPNARGPLLFLGNDDPTINSTRLWVWDPYGSPSISAFHGPFEYTQGNAFCAGQVPSNDGKILFGGGNFVDGFQSTNGYY
jgi:hypothetical protein